DARDVYSLEAVDPAPLAVPPGTPPPQSRREELGSGKARTVFEVTLADYATLEPRVPDLKLAVSGPDGPRQLSVRGRPLKFRSLVAEEAQGSPERAHHGPKPPIPVIVRAYLGSRLQFNALDLTSEEFVAELRRRRLIGLDLAGLIEQLRWEDLVKFAKLEPTPEECLRGIDLAESVIRHTRPLRSLPVKAA